MELKLLSSLEKVFPDGRGTDGAAPTLTALRGECISFQVALRSAESRLLPLWPVIDSPLAPYLRLRRVESVWARRPQPESESDAHYLSREPGLYPDVLIDLNGAPLILSAGQWRALFVDIDLPKDAAPGEFPLCLRLQDEAGETVAQAETTLQVLDAQLPPQTIVHTEWFHSDCLADYYQVPVFSPRHWEIITEFVKTAAKRGCNMLLTPHVTPALDTRVGGERTTVQLVGVTVENGQYSFDFSLLKRWVDMALGCGMQWLEMAHLFTQWGANAAPKVMARKDGKMVRLFGWDTPAVGGEYTRFLRAYLPELTGHLRAWGVADRCCFHISDEPSAQQLESYRAAKRSVEDLLQGFPIMDALSDYTLFAESGIEKPVVALNHMAPFLEKKVSPLWGYYCCGQTVGVTNRFLMMPLSRARVLGLQAWKFQFQGFLQWGYNFYNTYHSLAPINPFLDTEAGGAFPAGDAFLVYPGRDGKPVESIRLMAIQGAMQDARALKLLESLIGRTETLKIVDSEGEITLTDYPRNSQGLLGLRQKINQAIARQLDEKKQAR